MTDDRGAAALAERRHATSYSPHRLHSLAECPDPKVVTEYIADAAAILGERGRFLPDEKPMYLDDLSYRSGWEDGQSETRHEFAAELARLRRIEAAARVVVDVIVADKGGLMQNEFDALRAALEDE